MIVIVMRRVKLHQKLLVKQHDLSESQLQVEGSPKSSNID